MTFQTATILNVVVTKQNCSLGKEKCIETLGFKDKVVGASLF